MDVQITISLTGGKEYAAWIADQARVAQLRVAHDASVEAQPDDRNEDTPQQVKPRRVRRTKKQIEADLAVKTAEAAANVPPETVTTEEDDDLPPAKEATSGVGSPTVHVDNTVAILRAFIAKNGSAAIIAKLKEYDAKRVAEVAPDRIIAFLTELVAGT